MSHFTVLVTGENIDEALEPFIEQCESSEHEKYFSFCLEKTKQEMEEDWKNSEFFDDYDSVDEYASDYHGYISNENGDYGYRSNPNAKWDWYQLGGRWTGLIKVKSSANDAYIGRPGLLTRAAKPDYVDSALKKDIDFEGMEADQYKDALEYITPLFSGLVGLPMYFTWKALIEGVDNSEINEMRKIYHDQLAVKSFDNQVWNIDSLFENCPSFKEISKEPVFTQNHVDTLIEEYADSSKRTALHTYAILHEGQWYERGKMGWFGVSHDEKDKTTWEKQFNEFLDSLSDDTRINIVDCHI